MADTVIGRSIVIDGEISGDATLVVQGSVKGKIAVRDAVRVEPGAVVEASVASAAIEIAGQLTGSVIASDKVELKAACRVVGDIKSPRILIADGASFKGTVDMDVER